MHAYTYYLVRILRSSLWIISILIIVVQSSVLSTHLLAYIYCRPRAGGALLITGSSSSLDCIFDFELIDVVELHLLPTRTLGIAALTGIICRFLRALYIPRCPLISPSWRLNIFQVSETTSIFLNEVSKLFLVVDNFCHSFLPSLK